MLRYSYHSAGSISIFHHEYIELHSSKQSYLILQIFCGAMLCCLVVQLIHINFFFVVFFLLSLALLYALYVSHKLNFIMLSSRLSVTHTICLHFHFLVSRQDMGGI